MEISSSISVPLAAVTALVIASHYYYKNAFKFWHDRGLSGPKAYPIFGSFGRVLLDKEAGTKWMLEFGKVYGLYEGSKPVLVVSDPDVLRQICVKDFATFPNHPDQEFGSKLTRSFIFNARDDHWRHVRAILSPTFTSSKMRRMYKLIGVCANNMIEALAERLKSSSVINLKDLFGLYTMDAIASCCYGLRLASYRGEPSLTTASNQDEFVKLALKLFDFRIWRIAVVSIVHSSVLKKLNFSFIPSENEWAFARRVEQIIKKRIESGKNFDDYLQTLIDAKSDHCVGEKKKKQLEEEALDHEEHHAGIEGINDSTLDDGQMQSYKEKPLSELEVLSSATFLLVVGLETTSTLLTHCFYTLSFHQTIQEKLYQTVKSLAKYDDQNRATFDYDSLTSCQYLDAVISETLRKHPPAMQTDRCASEDYYLESHNLHIPKGTKVILTLKSIMEDPDNWPEPEVFDPERFMPENQHKIKPYSYCPFGVGPRHCLGMRFSLTESKLGLAKLLLEYRFEPVPGTRYPAESKLAFGFNSIRRPEVVAIKR